MAFREKVHRLQAISPCTLCALRRHTNVPRLAAASSYANPLPTFCRQCTSACFRCQRRTVRCADPTLWNALRATLRSTEDRAQLKHTLNTCYLQISSYVLYDVVFIFKIYLFIIIITIIFHGFLHLYTLYAKQQYLQTNDQFILFH